MRAIVLDREDRCLTIENASRNGRVITVRNGEYAMRGVSWAWGRPAYPRRYFALQYIPFIGPFIANYFFLHQTFVLIAPGVPSTLEPQTNTLIPSMSDEQSLSVMEAHADAMALGHHGMNWQTVVALGAVAVAILAILARV